MGMVKEFKEFALKGNVIDLAVAVVIAAAFGKVLTSLVDNILMPPLGVLIGKHETYQSSEISELSSTPRNMMSLLSSAYFSDRRTAHRSARSPDRTPMQYTLSFRSPIASACSRSTCVALRTSPGATITPEPSTV